MPPKRTTTTTTPMTDAIIKALIAQGVSTVLAEYEANRGSGNDDDSYDSGSGRRTERAARECTYNYFLKCQPLNFKGTEGSLRNALTWWNSHVKTISHDVAYGMTWKTLKKMMTGKYCPKGKIKKLDVGIKRLHDDLRVTATQCCWYKVTTAYSELMLLYKVTTAEMLQLFKD
ncbi:hypothetical protein Tco_1478084 [Tanacetum coccineum]